MALQSAFKERFEDMEFTRNQRLSLLQAEKDLQKNKSQLLSAKHSNISLLEQRCLIMDRQFASDNFRVSSLKSEIELLDRRYERLSRQLRVSSLKSEIEFLDRRYERLSRQLRELNVEVEELEELVKEREKFCAVKSAEMNEFTDRTEKFASDLRIKVDELKHRRDELKLFCSDAQNHDIQAAEKRKSELLALKEKIASTLETNKREQSELQKQLQSLR